MAGCSLPSLVSDGLSETMFLENVERNVETFQTLSTVLNAPIAEQEELEEENGNIVTELSRTVSMNFKKKQTSPSPGDFVYDDELKIVRNANRGRRTSSISGVTTSPSTPFHGFVQPEMTVVPNSGMKSSANRKNIILSFRDAIPILPLPVAVFCLILNIFIPGLGTILSGLVFICTTKQDFSRFDRIRILCMNCWVGLMQLGTVVLLAIGWVWSIIWGCAMVGLADSQRIESHSIEPSLDSAA